MATRSLSISINSFYCPPGNVRRKYKANAAKTNRAALLLLWSSCSPTSSRLHMRKYMLCTLAHSSIYLYTYVYLFIHTYVCVGCFALVKIFRKSGHEIGQQMKHLRERERERVTKESKRTVWECGRESASVSGKPRVGDAAAAYDDDDDVFAAGGST